MATHHSIKTFCQKHPAYTESAMRKLVFDDRGLRKAGAVLHNGRKVIIVEEKFLEVIEAKSAAAS